MPENPRPPSVGFHITSDPDVTAFGPAVEGRWGAVPEDLDSHLWGPPAANGYHLYYGQDDFRPYAILDVDDTDGFGPETVTILQQVGGRHVYAVHDFDNRGSTTSALMGASGARVQVFGQSGLLANFTVPNQPGTLWTVFELNGTTITPINTMSFVATPGPTPPGVVGQLHAAPSRVAAPAKRPAALR